MALAALALTTLSVRATFADPCPPDTLWCQGVANVETSAQSEVSCSPSAGAGLARTLYDIFEGGASAGVTGGSALLDCSAVCTDAYVVQGPPAGTPVTFRAQLTVFGSVFNLPGGFSRAQAHFGVPGQPFVERVYGENDTHGPFQEVLELALTRSAGEPFPLEFMVWARGQAQGTQAGVGCSLRFTELPPGATTTSCQGFRDRGVPAVPGSWGTLKAAYH
jgi:hypothetical protein